MAEEPNSFWKFAESPFTWGGIGVIFGTALVSPAWFKGAFIGGGIAIAIGFLRANSFKHRSIVFRIVFHLIAGTGLVALWIALWNVIPRPSEPLTKKDLQDLGILPPVGGQTSEALTKVELTEALQQYSTNRESKPTLDFSNEELRAQVLDVTQQLDKISRDYTEAIRHIDTLLEEARSDQAKITQIREQQDSLTGHYSHDTANLELVVKANCLDQIISIKLGKPMPAINQFSLTAANNLSQECYRLKTMALQLPL
jgi:hypothetical protein